MSKLVQDHIARGEARVVEAPMKAAPAAPVQNQVEVDRNFELPTALYGATVALYLAFIGIMAIGFASPGLIVPMGIFAVFIVAGFGVPAVWVRLRGNESKPMTAGRFKQAGIMTNTGPLAPRDAAIQMLILPVLIVLWGITTAVIAALV